jgi:hypothetical protein
MPRFHILLLLLVACLATATLAQAPAAVPKPDPEFKKLAVLVGHWKYEGEFKAGPQGPATKVAGEYTGQMILGGFFFQGLMTQGPPGGLHKPVVQLDLEGYDPGNKTIASSVYQDDGTMFPAVVTVSGNTVTWAGKFTIAGKPYLFKAPLVVAPDLMSGTEKAEISADGNTWTPFFEAQYTKIEPAPKK